MGTYVTTEGLQKKTLPEIKIEIETIFKASFGNDIDLDAESPFGQIVGILSQREANQWDALEEVWKSRDPDNSTGQSLDFISRETGTDRLSPAATQVEGVVLYGTEGTLISAGKQIKRDESFEDDPDNPVLFSLQTSQYILQAECIDIYLTPDPPGSSETFTITIDGTPYSYVTDGGGADDEEAVVDAIIALIEADPIQDMEPSKVGTTQLRLFGGILNYNVVESANWTIDLLGSGGSFACDETGAIPAPANSLIEIVTSVSGWDDVNNPTAGDTGRGAESDESLRLRREQNLETKTSTEDGIENALKEVDGVISASVESNRTMLTDGDGRPPKSFEAVVSGGANADIGQAIWDNMPAGIESHGTETVNVTDAGGNTQTVKFSRPTPLYAWARITRAYNTEETYPVDGDDLIKEAIVEWAEENLQIGDDVIRQRLNTPIYTVLGIGDITVELDATASPGDTPSYSETNITVAGNEYAEFDETRIVVQDP
jgi:uncharacterized phage protein gp47/JayE